MIRLLTDNIGLKLLSLAVATMLWLAIIGADRETTTSIAVPVQYRNLPQQLEISSTLTDSAYIEIRGTTTRLAGSNLTNAAVILDLAGEKRPGEHTFSILNENVVLPPNVDFLRAIPSQI